MTARHETEHLLQFARYRAAFASDRAASSSAPVDLITAAIATDEDKERRETIERVVGEVVERYQAEDEAEADHVGDARLAEWRDLSSGERDTVKFGKLEKSPTHWG